MLTQQKLKILLFYEKSTGVFTWLDRPISKFISLGAYKAWNTRYAGKKAGSCTNNGNGNTYIEINMRGKKYKAHRLAWLYIYGRWPTKIIDHIDGDGKNNRICNLRDVTYSENSRNMRMSTKNTSGICGVSWNAKDKRWIATIDANKKHHHLGSFIKKCEAIDARKVVEEKLGFGANHGSVYPSSEEQQ